MSARRIEEVVLRIDTSATNQPREWRWENILRDLGSVHAVAPVGQPLKPRADTKP